MRKILICALLFSQKIYASSVNFDTKIESYGLSFSEILKLSMSLFFVLLIIFLFSLAIKKINNISVKGSSDIRIVSGLNIGIKEKVVVVEVGRKQLVLGVTPQAINFLTELDEKINEDKKETMGFGDIFNRIKSRGMHENNE